MQKALVSVESPKIESVVVTSYPEMYCLFTVLAELYDSPIEPIADNAFRLLCNSMGRIDYSIDTCSHRPTRQSTQKLLVSFVKGDDSTNELASLQDYWFFADLAGLVDALNSDEQRELALLARKQFSLSELDRRTVKSRRLAWSKMQQGRLTSQMASVVMGIKCDKLRQLLMAFGATGNILDAIRDSNRDFHLQEVKLRPSLLLWVFYFWELVPHLTLIFWVLLTRPTLLLQILCRGERVMYDITTQRLSLGSAVNREHGPSRELITSTRPDAV